MGRDLIYLWENLLWLHTEMTNIQDNSTMYFTARLEFLFFGLWKIISHISLVHLPHSGVPIFVTLHYIYRGGTSEPHKSGTVYKTHCRHLTAAGQIGSLKSGKNTLKGKGKLQGHLGSLHSDRGVTKS